MARVQLALNVTDLDEAIDFYSELFATSPAKVRPGYANFAVADPSFKLVLMEHPDIRGSGGEQRGRRPPTTWTTRWSIASGQCVLHTFRPGRAAGPPRDTVRSRS
jgi:catechol 2,3-dioxygenase-like lactoylglutathione lyase family enzyme